MFNRMTLYKMEVQCVKEYLRRREDGGVSSEMCEEQMKTSTLATFFRDPKNRRHNG